MVAFQLSVPALLQDSQVDCCGWVPAVLGEALSAPRPMQALWAFTPTLPVGMGALLGPFSRW